MTDHAALPDIVEFTQRLLDGEGLNLLLNNAGTIHTEDLSDVTAASMRSDFETNCLAPLMISQVWTMYTVL